MVELQYPRTELGYTPTASLDLLLIGERGETLAIGTGNLTGYMTSIVPLRYRDSGRIAGRKFVYFVGSPQRVSMIDLPSQRIVRTDLLIGRAKHQPTRTTIAREVLTRLRGDSTRQYLFQDLHDRTTYLWLSEAQAPFPDVPNARTGTLDPFLAYALFNSPTSLENLGEQLGVQRVKIPLLLGELSLEDCCTVRSRELANALIENLPE